MRLAQVCAVVSGSVALVACVAWMLGQWRFGTFGESYIPMAPSTTWLFLLLNTALFLRARRPLNAGSTIFSHVAAVIVAGFCVLALSPWASATSQVIERWLAGPETTRAGIMVGRISPMTAVGFLATTIALLAELPPCSRRAAAQRSAVVLSLGVFLLGCIIITGYAVGMPILYSSGLIPMALATAIAFMALGAGLLFATDTARWPLRMFFDNDGAESSHLPQRFGWGMISLLVFTTVGIAALGFYHLREADAAARETARNDLNAVVDMKAQQITDWMNERRADAETCLYKRAASQFLAEPDNAVVRQELLQWMSTMQRIYDYRAVALLDARGIVRLTTPTNLSLQPQHVAEHVPAALRSREIVFNDLHGEQSHESVHLSFAVPIRITQDSNKPADGVLVLLIDPHRFLYPLIQSWPMPSRTAETLLVRRDKNDVLFLNELRHRTNTALRLRIPINRKDLPAAMAARGEAGTIEGVDYRGVPVLAAIRAVPDTPWFIVSKVDQEEIYIGLRHQVRTIWAGMGLLVFVACLGVALLWWRRNTRFLQLHLRTEQQRLAMVEHLAMLTRHANDIILLFDNEWRVIEANDRALATYGYTAKEINRLTLRDLRASESRQDFSAHVHQVNAGKGLLVEVVHRRKDGSTFPVETSLHMVEIRGRRFHQAIVRDITQRKAHEREIERLTRLYATLSQINQAIVRVKSREELAKEVTRVAIEFGGLRLAWIGQHNVQTHEVAPLGCAGEPQGLIHHFRHSSDDDKEHRCLCGSVLRDNHSCVANNLQAMATMHDWQLAMEQAGLRTAAAFPIRVHDMIWGVFGVYSSEPDVFQDKEVALLEEAAMDIGYAIEHLEDEAQRRQAEKALQESERRFRELMETIQLLGVMLNTQGQVIFCNDYVLRLTGWKREDVLGQDWFSRFTPGNKPLKQRFDEMIQAVGLPAHVENEIVTRQGERRLISWDNTLLRNEQGDIIGIASIGEDITERKRAEEALQQAEQKYRNIFENAVEGIYQSTPDGMIISANPAMAAIHGYATPEEFIADIHDAAHQLYVDPAKRVEFMRSLEEKGEVIDIENQVRRKDGTVIWVSSNARAVKDASGKVLLYEGTVEDITRRKQAEEAQRNSEQRLRGLIESVSDIVYEMTPAGVLTYVSPNWQESMGEPAADAIGKSFEPYIHPDDVHMCRKEIERALISGQPITTPDYRLVQRDGTIRWHYTKGVIHRGPDGCISGFMGVSRDVTERKQAEEDIRKLNTELESRVRDRTAQLEAANKELEAFSYSVSHDLRAPLRGINGFANILTEDYAPRLDDEGRRVLKTISDEAKRMGQLIDDLLAFSRIGRQAMLLSEVDMTALARRVFDECAKQAPGRDIRLQLHPLPPAHCDPHLLPHVWTNLISNAVKYTRVKPVAEIEITGRAEGGDLIYCVKDNGAGFDMRYVDRLFGVFQRLHADTEFEGTGVGLALVRRIIERHGGRVWTESTLGEGAAFYFTLPAAGNQ